MLECNFIPGFISNFGQTSSEHIVEMNIKQTKNTLIMFKYLLLRLTDVRVDQMLNLLGEEEGIDEHNDRKKYYKKQV